MTIPLSIIVAMTPNRVIGKDGKIPWNISEDMQLFKKLTTGNTVIMGRRTYESIPQEFRPLEERHNLVVSRKLKAEAGIIVCHTLDGALNAAEGYKKAIFVIGGARLYQEALPRADTLHVSHVKRDYEGDTFFPEVNWHQWSEEEKSEFNDFIYKRYKRK